ncbi:hypothetical protein ACRAWF_32325 [Streptomyces sp. L7]
MERGTLTEVGDEYTALIRQQTAGLLDRSSDKAHNLLVTAASLSAGGLAALLLCVGMSWRITRSLSRRLRGLRMATLSLAEDRLPDVVAPVEPRREDRRGVRDPAAGLRRRRTRPGGTGVQHRAAHRRAHRDRTRRHPAGVPEGHPRHRPAEPEPGQPPAHQARPAGAPARRPRGAARPVRTGLHGKPVAPLRGEPRRHQR